MRNDATAFMKRRQISIDDQSWNLLVEQAKQQGLTVSSLIRLLARVNVKSVITTTTITTGK